MMEALSHHREILKKLQASSGIAAYGEMLVEVQDLVGLLEQRHPGLPKDISRMDDAALHTEFSGSGNAEIDAILASSKAAVAKLVRSLAEENRERGVLPLAGDVLNLLYYVQSLQRVDGARLASSKKCEVVLAGPIGTSDKLGRSVAESLPVPMSAFSQVPGGEVGVYAIETVKGGQGNIPHYDRKDGAARDFLSSAATRDAVVAEAKRCGVFYTSMIAAGITRSFADFEDIVKRAHAEGVVVAFDTNYRGFVMEKCFPEQNSDMSPTQAFERLLPHIDILFAGREDLRKLYPHAANPTRAYGEAGAFSKLLAAAPGIVLIKAAEDGVFYRAENGGVLTNFRPEADIEAVDTTGAGDSHNAATLLALRRGDDIGVALRQANRISGKVIQRHGATLPEADLEELLRD